MGVGKHRHKKMWKGPSQKTTQQAAFPRLLSANGRHWWGWRGQGETWEGSHFSSCLSAWGVPSSCSWCIAPASTGQGSLIPHHMGLQEHDLFPLFLHLQMGAAFCPNLSVTALNSVFWAPPYHLCDKFPAWHPLFNKYMSCCVFLVSSRLYRWLVTWCVGPLGLAEH